MPGIPILCGSCWETFLPETAKFRCTNPHCPRADDADDVFYRYHGKTMPGVVLDQPPPAGFRLGARPVLLERECPSCRRVTRTRLCPICHNKLPPFSGVIEQPVVSIFGGRTAGKTCYLATLLHWLEQGGGQFGLTSALADDDSVDRLTELDKMFTTGVLPQLNVARQEEPIVYRLNAAANDSVSDILFFDCAGEIQSSLNLLENHAKQALHAKAIVFVIDPLMIPGLRQALGLGLHDPPAYDRKFDASFILGRLFFHFQNNGHLKLNEPFRVPVAFTLTKLDDLVQHPGVIPPGSPLRGPSTLIRASGPGRSQLDMRQTDALSDHILGLLNNWDPGLYTWITTRFATYKCFAVSALGGQPVNNRVARVKPIRVDEPLLWLFSRVGMVASS